MVTSLMLYAAIRTPHTLAVVIHGEPRKVVTGHVLRPHAHLRHRERAEIARMLPKTVAEPSIVPLDVLKLKSHAFI